MSELLIEERTGGIGGSDCASLFGLGWGCRRRLWYDKSGTEPDFERTEEAAMSLGRYMEPYWREQYQRETGRTVTVPNETGLVRHSYLYWLLAHVDGVITGADEHAGPGVLEIKSVHSAVWWKYRREGIPIDYILQVQHGLAAAGAEFTWGSYAIGNRDSGALLRWDVERDKQWVLQIELEGGHFWHSLGDEDRIPERLEPDDRRCQRCRHRIKCQGNSLIELGPVKDLQPDESLRPLYADYKERHAIKKEAEALLDETVEELKTRIGDRQGVTVSDGKIYFRMIKKERYDSKELAKAYNSLRAKLNDETVPSADHFKKSTSEEYFRVF